MFAFNQGLWIANWFTNVEIVCMQCEKTPATF